MKPRLRKCHQSSWRLNKHALVSWLNCSWREERSCICSFEKLTMSGFPSSLCNFTSASTPLFLPPLPPWSPPTAEFQRLQCRARGRRSRGPAAGHRACSRPSLGRAPPLPSGPVCAHSAPFLLLLHSVPAFTAAPPPPPVPTPP